MTEPQAPPSAQVVAQEFVKQYYTLLNAAPSFLHRFYSHNSSFIHGEDQIAVTGQAEIHRKIMSLNFNNCHARICQVDSQSSVAGSVVVQVIGELSNADQPMRRFVQSFVLAPQTANKYYVHVDIFRYQDDYVSVHDANESEEKFEEEALEYGETDEPILNEETAVPPAVEDDSNNETVQLQEPIENGGEESELAVGTGPDADHEMADDESKAPAAVPDSEPKADDTPTAAVVPDENVSIVNKPKVTESTPVAQAVVPPKPMTWAAMASRNAGGASPANCTSTSTTAPARVSAAVSDQKPEQTALPPRTSRPAPASEERAGGSNGRVIANGSKDADSGSKRTVTSAPVVYSDNQQVFVGNLPQHLTDQELIDFFARFGKVLEFRINRKTGGQGGNNLGQKNFGFMIFESPETVEKILAARPIHMNKHRLNVEEKKPKEELAAARLRPGRFPATGGKTNANEAGSNFVRSVANGPGPRRNREFRSDARSISSDEGRTT